MFNTKISSGASEFNPYENNNYLKGSREFLKNNSIIAQLAFLLLVIFIFFILLRVGIAILSWIFSFSKDPVLIKGTMNGDQKVIIPQAPKTPGAIPILRSKNEREGLEFTWSAWLYIEEPSTHPAPTMYSHVFSKGSAPSALNNNGIMSPNNAPGLYIDPTYRKLVVVMSTFENKHEKITIDDIPIRKWINVIIRIDQHKLDIFINGMLTKSKMLENVPKQNYEDVYINLNGGFNGKISKLQYFAYTLGTNAIQSIVNAGPDLTALNKDPSNVKPYYLSFRWFFPQQSAEMQ